MDLCVGFLGSKINGGEICLSDSDTTHTILRDQKYFSHITLVKANVNTISSPADLIDGFRRATIMLPCGMIFHINDALYPVRCIKNMLSFKDLRHNGYHIKTTYDNNKEYLCITHIISSQKLVVEKLPAFFFSELYYTTIITIELNMVMSHKLSHPNIFMLWHDRLGHPRSTMMRRIIENFHGHPLKNQKILLYSDYLCTACSQGKLIVRPSHTKFLVESPTFLERIQGDICGPIHPPSELFHYFMLLIDASSRWSHVCLLSTRNVAISRLLA